MNYRLRVAAYNKAAGDTVALDGADPCVALNVEAGVLEPLGPPPPMTCPICVEQGAKKPARLSSEAALAEHYSDDHPAFAVPSWAADQDLEGK